MRIAFVSANRETMPDAVIPFGLLHVMAATPARHERALVDLCFEPDPEAALRRAIEALDPDLVALGLRNIQNNDYSGIGDNVAYYRRLVAAIRGATRAPVILGGAGLSVMPELLLARLEADYAIAGEGELTFPLFVEALAAGAALDALPGLYRREGERVLAPGRAPPRARLDALPPIDRRLADERYYARYGIDSVQTKRGCGLRCTYCTYPRIEGRLARRKHPELVADDFERVLEHHPRVRHVFVVDSVFNLPSRHALAVCDALAERRLSLPWTCYVNPARFEPALAERMARAGCTGVEIGSDSGSDEVLARLRKGFDTAQVRAAAAAARAAGLRDCHTFVLGTQGETLDDVRRTLDFVAELDPAAAILLPWVDDHEALDPEQCARRRRLRAGVLALLAERAPAFPRWIVPPLGLSFDERAFDALRARGFSGPLWQHIGRAPAHRRRRRSEASHPCE